ncbi:hypothetical protein DL598_11805, partial [Shigella dysenteriae]|nr:hypothetical protein [Shigella dysenteriae]EHX4644699.1 hypothetical protein [Shigella dysenteriae]
NESQKEPEKNHESVVFTEHAVHGGTYGGQETAGAATERGSVSVEEAGAGTVEKYSNASKWTHSKVLRHWINSMKIM